MSMPRMTYCQYCGSPPNAGPEALKWMPARRLDQEALDASPELRGKNAVVLYFETDADREEFVALVKLAKPGMRAVNI